MSKLLIGITLSFLLLSLVFGGSVLGQNRTAIFLVYEVEGQICPNKKQLLNSGEVYCLERDPLLYSDSFEAVSDIYNGQNDTKRQFDLFLRPKGQKALNTLSLISQDHRIAIVVNNKLVSVINLRSPFNTNKISLWNDNNIDDFIRIHKELKNAVQ